MAQEIHTFKLRSTWNGNSDGEGTATGDGWSVAYGAPSTFGGAPPLSAPSLGGIKGAQGRANPEELLISAIVSCYSITLAYLAERKKLPLERIEMLAEGDVERQLGGALKFTAIRLAPRLIAPGADEAQVRSLTDCAHKAEQYCPISNAVKGNVSTSVEPEVDATV